MVMKENSRMGGKQEKKLGRNKNRFMDVVKTS